MSPAHVFEPGRKRVARLHDRLLAAYGAQNWWPGDTRLEIIVGAVLTQNTAWTNVERAIERLKDAGVLSVQSLLELEHEALAELVRPAGYYNIKARRLKNLLRRIVECEGEENLARQDTGDLRRTLLSVNGVGPETADDILLYAFHRPVFVIDAYTRRLFGRLGWADGSERYDELRTGVEKACGADVGLMQELHALIVHHAKTACRTRPVCMGCPLQNRCEAMRARRE